jgi:cell division protein FtsB
MRAAKLTTEILALILVLFFLYQAGRSVACSIEHQIFLYQQKAALAQGRVQTEQVNRELRQGLVHYQSPKGLEKLARERLNVAGPGEIVIRLGK